MPIRPRSCPRNLRSRCREGDAFDLGNGGRAMRRRDSVDIEWIHLVDAVFVLRHQVIQLLTGIELR